MASVGIIGASGYAGSETLRLVLGHPDLDLAWVTAGSKAGTPVAELYPNLAAATAGLTYATYDPAMADDVDVVVVGLPHGVSQTVVPDLLDAGVLVADLAADFRLQDPALYPRWYGAEHTRPDLLGSFVYGLPELTRDQLRAARAIAVPGCFPTAAILALAPLVAAGAIATEGVVVDAATGVSGAGRALKEHTAFTVVDEDFRAYGLLDHRHTPEIEQGAGLGPVLFTPHLAPMNRGILATCYARPAPDSDPSTEGILGLLADRYADEPFVVVSETPPGTKATSGANTCHLSARFDPRTGWVVVLAAIDNLVKGTAGNAVQSINLALGLPETTGLPTVGLLP